MAKAALVFLLVIHGAIHLMGFVKEWHLAPVSQLKGGTLFLLSAGSAKIVGVLWLAAFMLFLLSAGAFLFHRGGWWMPAMAAIVLSQALIILYWQDAKFGTIANLILVVVCLAAYGQWNFNRMVRVELAGFQPAPAPAGEIVTAAKIMALPPVVQRWLTRSGMVGREEIRSAHLRQSGKMLSKPGGAWMTVSSEQYFRTTEPGFYWIADVKMMPMVYMSGRDKYQDGRGQMLIKVASLFPVADASGAEADQGAMLRYLAETVWLPSAVLSRHITWEAVDDLSARATMNYGGVTASGLFTFNEAGDFKSFLADRYYYRKEGSTLEPWFVQVDEGGYKEFSGIRVPARCSVTWRFKTGDFTWYRLEIEGVEYNEGGISDDLRL